MPLFAVLSEPSNLDDLAAVNMAAIVLSISLWSFYVLLSVVMVLALRRRKTSLSLLPAFCTIFVFVCNFGDTICIAFTGFKGFLTYPGGKTLYFILYYERAIDHGWYAATSILRCLTGLGADVLMIWRLFVIWSRDIRVIYLPISFVSLAGVCCVTVFLYDFRFAPRWSQHPAWLEQYHYVSVAMLTLDILNSWYCTGLICYQLISMLRQKKAAANAHHELVSDMTTGSPYRRIIWVLIQSGMLYSLSQAAFLICMLTNSAYGEYIANYLISRVIGIATVLIILQLNTAPLRSNNASQAASAASGSFSMPVFRKFNKEDEDDEHIALIWPCMVNNLVSHLPYQALDSIR
ncbi:hypothetical protein FRB95_008323 [Tulasnella sp. JGI-2019a]|nr:hypothetical protein FRB95_008323 [Tulasnella sp. JGI-2019a]